MFYPIISLIIIISGSMTAPICPDKRLRYFRHQECTKFYECSRGEIQLFTCPNNLHFNAVISKCDVPEDAGCEKTTTTTSTTETSIPNYAQAVQEAIESVDILEDLR